MSSFPLWAERLYNRPIALDRFKNETLCKFADQRIFGAKPDKIDAQTLAEIELGARAREAVFYGDSGDRKPFRHRNGIAMIPVEGTLVHKGGFMSAESGLTSYDSILTTMRVASADGDISGIFMPYKSGGGEVAGMFAAAEEMATMSQAEGGKPIYAYLDDQAASAAYVLASSADKIFGRREVIGGSLAALINVVDKSKAMERMGLKPIVVRASWADRKARGGMGEEIDEELIGKLEGFVEEASEMLVEFVSAMRPIKPQAIRDLRGEVFSGEDLVKLGLMDAVASEDEVWAKLERAAARA